MAEPDRTARPLWFLMESSLAPVRTMSHRACMQLPHGAWCVRPGTQCSGNSSLFGGAAAPRPPPVGSASSLLQRGLGFGTGSGLGEISVLTLPLADSFVNTSSPPAPSVTAVTHFPGSHGNKAVCSVQITIQAQGETIKKRLRVRNFQQKIPKVCLSVRQTAGDPGNPAGNSQRPPKGRGSRRCQSPRGTGDI